MLKTLRYWAGKEERLMRKIGRNCLIISYCVLMSLRVFRWDITNTKMCLRACVLFYASPHNPGCKWSLWEQRMRPLPSISLIKSKLLYLSLSFPLPLYLLLFHSFSSFFVERMTSHYQSPQSVPSSLSFLCQRLVAGTFWTLNLLVC